MGHYIDTKEKLFRSIELRRQKTLLENIGGRDDASLDPAQENNNLEIRSLLKNKWPMLEKLFMNLGFSQGQQVVKETLRAINGNSFNLRFETYSNTSVDLLVANIVAAIAVTTDSISQKQNAYNFLVLFFNPYGQESRKGVQMAPVTKLIVSENENISRFSRNEIMDMLSDSFFRSMEYLIKNRKYDPEKNQPFSYLLLKFTWPQRFINLMRNFAKKKEIEGDRFTRYTQNMDSGEEAFQDEPMEKELTNDQKVELIASKLPNSYRKVFYAWYKLHKNSEGKNVNVLGDMSKEEDTIAKALQAVFPDMKNSTLRNYLTHIRQSILEMLKDSRFREQMGVSGTRMRNLKSSEILKGTQSVAENEIRKEIRKIIKEISKR